MTIRRSTLAPPAAGDACWRAGRVVKAGRTLTLSQAEVFAQTGGAQKLIAFLTANLMTLEGRDALSD